MIMPPFLLALSLTQLSLAALPRPVPVLSLEDPRGDDDGPGGYSYPSGGDYHAGDFDLRKVELTVEGQVAIFSVTLGSAIRRPDMVRRSHATELDLSNGIYVQNIDLYIDDIPHAGFTDAIPGRNVTLDPDSAWDTAVVITPQPALTRALLKDSLPPAVMEHVYVATDVRAVGPTVVVRIPIAELGAMPRASWGYAVLLTGAIWDNSFAAVERLTGGYEPNAFTMPVYAVPEPQAFGGGLLDRFQPRVLDLLSPPGRDQHAILGAFDATKQRRAVVPMVYPDFDGQQRARSLAKDLPRVLAAQPAVTSTRATAVSATGPGALYRISDVDQNRAVIPVPEGTVNLWRLGTVLDERGETIARVVVTAVFPGFVMATAVEGEKGLRAGARVRFNDESTEKRKNP